MAVRSTMATLIAFVRTKISDTGTTPVFTDQNIQDQLDVHRTDVRYAALRPLPTYLPGPSVVYLDYYSDAQYWEDDYVIQDLTYTAITSQVTTYEPLVGHWAFPAQPTGIGVRITGKVFDIYGSSADLLENWATILKLNYRFESDSQRFFYTEQVKNILETAARYRLLAQAHSIRMTQGDANPDQDGGGIVYPNIAGGSEFV